MKIAMIGQRGVPATFGGIERHVEELGARLVEEGHEVIVYTRTNYADRLPEGRYRGMELRYLPTIGTKHLDAIVPSLLGTVDAIIRRVDVAHYHAIGPGVGALLARLTPGVRVVQTIHGLDHERAKWGGASKAVLRAAAWLSAKVPHEVIVVSRALKDHYRTHYGRSTSYICNGVGVQPKVPAGPALARLGLEAGSYLLFVGRLVPEKAPDLLVEAFAGVTNPDARLVIVGGSSFTDDYVNDLEAAAARDPRVLMAGYQYGDDLVELYSNAAGFVLPSLLEGLPLTLLEAASFGLPIVASDIPPHVEVIAPSGPGHRLFPVGDAAALTTCLNELLEGGDEVEIGAKLLHERVVEDYSWDRAARETALLYRGVHVTEDESSLTS